MKVDIKEVFIYSNDFFYDYSNDRKYEYIDFIREMDALASPKTMYQDSFIYEKLMLSGIVKGLKSQVKEAILLVPFKFTHVLGKKAPPIASIRIYLSLGQCWSEPLALARICILEMNFLASR